MKTNSSPLFYSEEREENVLSEKKKKGEETNEVRSRLIN